MYECVGDSDADRLSVDRMMKAIVSGFKRSKPEHPLSLNGSEKTRRFVERL